MNPVISSVARTPIGRFSGEFSALTAMDLGSVAIQGALERANLSPENVDEVIFGHVLQAGQGQITAPIYTLELEVWGEFDGHLTWDEVRRNAEASVARLRASGRF